MIPDGNIPTGRLAAYGAWRELVGGRPQTAGLFSINQIDVVIEGYRVELAIPLLSVTGAPVAPGTMMGVNVAMNDDDDGGRRDRRFVWFGNTTLDFAGLGSLIFTGSTAPPPTATPTPATAVATNTPTRTVAVTLGRS